MGFNWKAIQSYEDAEVALYRLLGEMLRRKATLSDLDQIRAFLLHAELSSEGWMSLGEALHRTTSGSPVGYDIWLAWLESFREFEVDDDQLGETWMEFGQDVSEASEDYDGAQDVLPSPEAPRPSSPTGLPAIRAPARDEDTGEVGDGDTSAVADDDDTDATSMSSSVLRHHTHTGVIGQSPTQLLQLVPAGPYELRIFGQSYDNVDEYTILTLLKRGLFFAAHVRFEGQWVPSWQHPAFEQISGQLQIEAARILTRNVPSDDATETHPIDRD